MKKILATPQSHPKTRLFTTLLRFLTSGQPTALNVIIHDLKSIDLMCGSSVESVQKTGTSCQKLFLLALIDLRVIASQLHLSPTRIFERLKTIENHLAQTTSGQDILILYRPVAELVRGTLSYRFSKMEKANPAEHKKLLQECIEILSQAKEVIDNLIPNGPLKTTLEERYKTLINDLENTNTPKLKWALKLYTFMEQEKQLSFQDAFTCLNLMESREAVIHGHHHFMKTQSGFIQQSSEASDVTRLTATLIETSLHAELRVQQGGLELLSKHLPDPEPNHKTIQNNRHETLMALHKKLIKQPDIHFAFLKSVAIFLPDLFKKLVTDTVTHLLKKGDQDLQKLLELSTHFLKIIDLIKSVNHKKQFTSFIKTLQTHFNTWLSQKRITFTEYRQRRKDVFTIEDQIQHKMEQLKKRCMKDKKMAASKASVSQVVAKAPTLSRVLSNEESIPNIEKYPSFREFLKTVKDRSTYHNLVLIFLAIDTGILREKQSVLKPLSNKLRFINQWVEYLKTVPDLDKTVAKLVKTLGLNENSPIRKELDYYLDALVPFSIQLSSKNFLQASLICVA